LHQEQEGIAQDGRSLKVILAQTMHDCADRFSILFLLLLLLSPAKELCDNVASAI
jgi:hypothetical protein